MNEGGIRRGVLATFLVLILAVVAPVAVRWLWPAETVVVRIEGLEGRTQSVSLRDLERLPVLERRGEVQNQFGNWRDAGLYSGVRIRDLPGIEGEYEILVAIAADGYQMEISRSRVEDDVYPMILALSFDNLSIPAWEEGPRLVVLPVDGRVSNEEAGVLSAGSFWVKNIERLILR